MISFVYMVSESSSNDLVDIDLFFSVCIYQIFFKTKQHKISYTNNCQNQCNNNQWYLYHVPFSIVRFPVRTLRSALSITCNKKYDITMFLWNWLLEIFFKCTTQWLKFCDGLFQFIILKGHSHDLVKNSFSDYNVVYNALVRLFE